MEELLNKLIEKGWVPFGENRINEINRAEQYAWNWNWCCWGSKDAIQRRKSLRQLVSKESWLWQFVCNREHRFINERNYDGVSLDKRLKNPYVDYDGVNTEYERITGLDYQYWIIESALKDESELESFILDNVKIWE